MLLGMNKPFEIDNPRNYPARVVEELREFLARGVAAQPDPKRQGFYDVEVEGRVFFICIFSPSGAITLLATWPKSVAPDSGIGVQFEDLSAA